MITKPYFQNKALILVNTLRDNKVDSKARLLAKWKEDPKFLLTAFTLWTDRNFHKILQSMWPPVDGRADEFLKNTSAKGKPTKQEEDGHDLILVGTNFDSFKIPKNLDDED